MCFSIQPSLNNDSSITFIVISSSPKSLLFVQQHIAREQLSLFTFPVSMLPKTAVRVKLIEVKRSLLHTLINFCSPSSSSTSSSFLLGQPKGNHPTKNLLISCWIRRADSPLNCTIPRYHAKKRTGTHRSVDMKTKRLLYLVAAHSCTKLKAVWTTLEDEHVDHYPPSGENTILEGKTRRSLWRLSRAV